MSRSQIDRDCARAAEVGGHIPPYTSGPPNGGQSPPTIGSSNRAPGGRGFTLVELVIVVCLLAFALSVLVNFTTSLRDEAKIQQARVLLRTLDEAIKVYAADCGQYPRGAPDGDAAPCIRALLNNPRSRPVLEELGWPWSRQLDRPEDWVDPWGKPLRYVTTLQDEEAVRMNGERPFWVCSGPDRLFGEGPAEAAEADNLRTDQPF